MLLDKSRIHSYKVCRAYSYLTRGSGGTKEYNLIVNWQFTTIDREFKKSLWTFCACLLYTSKIAEWNSFCHFQWYGTRRHIKFV